MTLADADDALSLHPAALAAVARSRAHGMHLWGQLLGIEVADRPHEGAALMRTSQGADPTSLAALVDICLGSAIRADVGPGHRLATTALTLQHTATPADPAAGVTCGSRVVWSDPGRRRALAQAYVEDEAGTLVAAAQAWFVVMPVAEGTTIARMPWERTAVEVPTLTAADLTETELQAVRAASAGLTRAETSGRPVAEELIGATWRVEEQDGRAVRLTGTAPTGPHLGNRVGNLQGGALYGYAAVAAERLIGPGMRLVEGSMQYLRPGDGAEVRATATLARRGRQAAFVDVVVDVDGRTTNSAHFTFLGD